MKYKLRIPFVNILTEQIMPKDTILYSCSWYDYGIARDDTREFGIEHVSVTYDSNGNYPFFTVPRAYLERIN